MQSGKMWNRLVSVGMVWMVAAAFAQSADVRCHVIVAGPKGASPTYRDTVVVAWLTPVSAQPPRAPRSQTESSGIKLVQKNKRFEPHVLVVEVGSVVDFPNRDPFFHNVFSLFDGKRFDLGLYEAGSTRSVRFDRPGICYIFCNIHAQMSAVVVVVPTPFYALASGKGDVVIPNVTPGRYQLNLWQERVAPKLLKEASRQVTVGEDGTVLGPIHLQESQEVVMVHPNKYGKDYDPQVFSSPIYVQQ